MEYILKQELVVVQTPESKTKMQLKDFLIRAEGNTELFLGVVVWRSDHKKAAGDLYSTPVMLCYKTFEN